MVGLSRAAPGAETVVSTWERGRHEHPVDRALTLLAALSGRPRGELAELSLERRDRMILAARSRLFGADAVGRAACPACGCPVEVAFRADTLADEPGLDEPFEIDVAAERVPVRLPTSRDAAAAVQAGTVEQARMTLVRAAVSTAPDPEGLAARTDVVVAVEAALAERSRLSAAVAELACPDCEAQWSVDVDAAAFTWCEIEVLAARLLGEVDVLARRYGWSERDILALHPDRRRFYLELAS